MRIARVEPLTRTRAVRGPFDYRLTDEQAMVDVGSLLRVPFGGSRSVGVVVEMAGNSRVESAQLAAAYGVDARRTSGVDDTREALQEAVGSGKPELIEVRVAPGMALS